MDRECLGHKCDHILNVVCLVDIASKVNEQRLRDACVLIEENFNLLFVGATLQGLGVRVEVVNVGEHAVESCLQLLLQIVVVAGLGDRVDLVNDHGAQS